MQSNLSVKPIKLFDYLGSIIKKADILKCRNSGNKDRLGSKMR
jgi:hypothetical protein